MNVRMVARRHSMLEICMTFSFDGGGGLQIFDQAKMITKNAAIVKENLLQHDQFSCSF